MRRRSTRLAGAFVALSVLAAVVPATAGEGRIPIWQPTALGPGSTPGKYVVTRDVTTAAGGGVTIFVSGGPGFEEVDIDLNGFTLLGDPGGGVPVIEVSGMRSVTIRNGSIRSLGPASLGIRAVGVEKLVIEDVKTQDGEYGFFLEAVPNFAIRRNIVVAAGLEGIYVDGVGGAPSPTTGTIEDNQVKDASGMGIHVFNKHSGVQIVRNRIDRVGGPGIFVQDGNTCLVSENNVQEAGDGILLEQIEACKLYNNVTSFNNGNGIFALSTFNSLFLDNVASNNAASGIETDGERNLFDRNVVSVNGCYGIRFAGRNNTYGRNTARFNSGACGAPCAIAPVEVCPAPYGGGAFAPDLCVDAVLNTSLCDNMMPGPPRS